MEKRYSTFNLPARILHWLMAIMIIAMLFLGAGMMTSLRMRPEFLNWHIFVGLCVLLLAGIRLLNRILSKTPALPSSLPRWQVMMAHGSHWLLYILMFTMPLLGWATLSSAGFPVHIFHLFTLPPIASIDPQLYTWFRRGHGLFAFLLFAVIICHISAALLHAWVLKDNVFSQIWLHINRRK